jgi:hypothetical protein
MGLMEYASYRIYVNKNQNVTKITVTTDYKLKNNGSQGPGIEYVVYRVDEGNRPDEVGFVNNSYGIYQGGDNPQLPKMGQNYKKLFVDYSLAPIDETNANAKQHDLDYDKEKIAGLTGVLSKKSSEANAAYIKRAQKTIDKFKKGQKR